MVASGDSPAVPGSAVRPPVVCCIEDSGARSRSALEYAARLACRRRERGGWDRLVAVVYYALVSLAEPPLESGWTVSVILESVSTAVIAMIEEVSKRFGLTIEVDEIFGSSQAVIIQAVRARDSDAVILPVLNHDAGRMARWSRRSLVSGLIARTHAVVIDEYDGCEAPASLALVEVHDREHVQHLVGERLVSCGPPTGAARGGHGTGSPGRPS